MSLQSQLNSFVTRVAEMFQQVETRTGALDRLNTSAKSDLVTAINELAAREIGGGSSGVAFTHSQVSATTALDHQPQPGISTVGIDPRCRRERD